MYFLVGAQVAGLILLIVSEMGREENKFWLVNYDKFYDPGTRIGCLLVMTPIIFYADKPIIPCLIIGFAICNVAGYIASYIVRQAMYRKFPDEQFKDWTE